eukprot:1185638-Prorocentrum_minimum.AAC.1
MTPSAASGGHRGWHTIGGTPRALRPASLTPAWTPCCSSSVLAALARFHRRPAPCEAALPAGPPTRWWRCCRCPPSSYPCVAGASVDLDSVLSLPSPRRAAHSDTTALLLTSLATVAALVSDTLRY